MSPGGPARGGRRGRGIALKLKGGLDHREEEIKASVAMIALATQSYWNHPTAIRDLQVAARMGRPIIILRQRGVEPPAGAIADPDERVGVVGGELPGFAATETE